jgi:hypothetical protein
MKARATDPQTAYHKSRPRGSNFHRSQTIHDPGERPDIYRPNLLRIVSSRQRGLHKSWITADGEVITLKHFHYRAMELIAENVDRLVPWLDDITTASERTGMCRQMWINVMADFEALNAMRIERRKSAQGNLINVYIPLPHPLWDQFRLRPFPRKPKSTGSHNCSGISQSSVGNSVSQTHEEATDKTKTPDPVKSVMREVPAAERPPAVEVNGFAEAAAAYSRAGIYTGLAMWIVWALAKLRLDKMDFLRFTQQHKIARYDSLDAGWRDVFQKFARLYARAYPAPAAAPNRLESVSKYSPVAFHDGDPPPRPPRRDDDEMPPAEKQLTPIRDMLKRDASGCVRPPADPPADADGPALPASNRLYQLVSDDVLMAGIDREVFLAWLWKQKNRPDWTLSSEAEKRQWIEIYLKRKRMTDEASFNGAAIM